MAEFLKLGRMRVNLDCVHAVREEEDGSVVLHAHGQHAVYTGEDAAALLAWVDGHVSTHKPAPSARQRA